MKESERISKKEFNEISVGIFSPLKISRDIQDIFVENAQKLGLPNPFDSAVSTIANIQSILSNVPLTQEGIPQIENPFKKLPEPTLAPIQGLPQLPNPTDIQGYGQINLPTAVAGNQINPITKLTVAEDQLLSPAEKLIRQRQRTA